MESKFGGIPVERQSKFGGVPVGQEPEVPTGYQEPSPSVAGASPEEAGAPLTARQEALREVAQEVGPLQAFLIGTGKGMYDIARGVGLAEPAGEVEREAFAALEQERPIAATAGEITGQAAPFAAAGPLAGGVRALGARAIPALAEPAGLGARMLGTGLLGATEAGVLTRGEGAGFGDVAAATGAGGAVGIGAEILLPVVGRLGRKIFQRVRGAEPTGPMLDRMGRPTPELQEALSGAGMSFEDLTQDAAEAIQGQARAGLDPVQVARKEFLEAEGIAPTRAQITRSATDFQAQQEAAKTSTRVRDAIEKQEAALTTRFNQAVLETGGQAYSPSVSVIEKVVDKATTLDQKISDLYRLAREAAPTEKNIDFSKLASSLRRNLPKDSRTGGNIRAIVGEMQAQGVLDKGMKVRGKVSVEAAEELRKLMNELYDPQNPFGNMILREFKETLDDDVFRASGADIFREARAAKRSFEEDLARAKISKFDSRKQNLVRDLLENKIDPDLFSEKVVFGKGWRADDLEQLKAYVGKGPEWNDLKADVLASIRDQSFIGPEDASGFRALSRDKLERAINKIGEKKLNVIFDKEEREFLSRMLKVAKLREPVRGTAMGRGPSAQAIGRIEQKLRNLPVMGALVDVVNVDAAGRAALRAKPEKARVPYSRRMQIEAQIPAAVSAAAIPAISEQRRSPEER